MKILVLSANLGGFDAQMNHVEQSVKHDLITLTDENFPPRHKALLPRLQAKIPKCFAWQMYPGYDYYVWLDANLTMTSPDTLKWLVDAVQGHDIAVLKHPRRNTVKWEARYLYRGLKEQSMYMVGRYDGEMWKEQMEEINADKDFVDDLLAIGGVFIYRDTPEIRSALKEWWYHCSRYNVQDQISFSYVLKKSGVKINALPDVYNECPYLSHRGHNFRAK